MLRGRYEWLTTKVENYRYREHGIAQKCSQYVIWKTSLWKRRVQILGPGLVGPGLKGRLRSWTVTGKQWRLRQRPNIFSHCKVQGGLPIPVGTQTCDVLRSTQQEQSWGARCADWEGGPPCIALLQIRSQGQSPQCFCLVNLTLWWGE